MEFIYSHYAYWFISLLLCIGLYGVLFKRNLVKKLIGMTIFQASVILFFVSIASKWDATVPVKSYEITTDIAANYINPLPHTLMLTAIVVGVATQGVAFALLISLYKRFKTLDEQELLDKIQ